MNQYQVGATGAFSLSNLQGTPGWLLGIAVAAMLFLGIIVVSFSGSIQV